MEYQQLIDTLSPEMYQSLNSCDDPGETTLNWKE
jgi:uncharacterized protein YeaC (DUF1315 family)